MKRLRFRGCWLLLTVGLLLSACPPPLPSGGDDGAVSSDGGCALGSDMCSMPSDPVVGRACGAGAYCPCGYFCPMGKCEVADFHPPCDLR